MTLSPGTRLSLYEVVSSIGAGGRSEVYRAMDTKLGRGGPGQLGCGSEALMPQYFSVRTGTN